jgi:hypothetical protein
MEQELKQPLFSGRIEFGTRSNVKVDCSCRRASAFPEALPAHSTPPIASMLTRTSCIPACPTTHPSHHHYRQFHSHRKAQLERAAAIRLARFGLFKLDCVCREGIGRRLPRYADRWREAAREDKMGDNARVKVSLQRQNMTCLD